MQCFINEIEVKDRLREDMGDIAGLAESIQKYGLLHPIVVTESGDKYELVAGGRRLAACKSLGMESVKATLLRNLSGATLRKIELEENLQRKDLTEYERSKNLLELLDVTLEGLKDESSEGYCKETLQKPQGGRPEKNNSLEKAVAEIGVTRQNIYDTRKHVAAVEKYPELMDEPKHTAIKAAKELNKNPEQTVSEAVQAVKCERLISIDEIDDDDEIRWLKDSAKKKGYWDRVLLNASTIKNTDGYLEAWLSDEDYEGLEGQYDLLDSATENLIRIRAEVRRYIDERKKICVVKGGRR